MAINKATLAKEIDGVIEYIYPKTSADIVVYDENYSVGAMLDKLDNTKVDKVSGKGLSTNDFTNEYKNRLDSFENYVIDDALSSNSRNPLENRAIYEEFRTLKINIGDTSELNTIYNATSIVDALKKLKNKIEN